MATPDRQSIYVLLREWIHSIDEDYARALEMILDQAKAGPILLRAYLELTLLCGIFGVCLGALAGGAHLKLAGLSGAGPGWPWWVCHILAGFAIAVAAALLACLIIARKSVARAATVLSDVLRTLEAGLFFGMSIGLMVATCCGLMPGILIGLLYALPGLLSRRKSLPMARPLFPLLSYARPGLNEVAQALLVSEDGEFAELIEEAERLAQVQNWKLLVQQLAHDQWQRRFVARWALVRIGGEVMVALLHRWRPAKHFQTAVQIKWIIKGISRETRLVWRKARRRPYCCRHLVRWEKQRERHMRKTTGPQIEILTVTYYGCRVCGASRDYSTEIKKIVIVLDREMSQPQEWHDGVLRVNWFWWLGQHGGMMCDYDEIEVGRASDEDIEQLCTCASNDIDWLRRRRLRKGKIPCRLRRRADHSELALHRLRAAFGRKHRPTAFASVNNRRGVCR